jgi:hypothetical protein
MIDFRDSRPVSRGPHRIADQRSPNEGVFAKAAKAGTFKAVSRGAAVFRSARFPACRGEGFEEIAGVLKIKRRSKPPKTTIRQSTGM